MRKCHASLKEVALLIATIFLVITLAQSASGADIYIGIIQRVQYTVVAQDTPNPPGGGSYAAVSLSSTFTSWLKTIDSTRTSSEFHWITTGDGLQGVLGVNYYGWITVSFPNYIAISYVEITNNWGIVHTSVAYGVGYSHVIIGLTGVGASYLYIKTNYIPQQYWGQTIQIALEADTGGVSNYVYFNLRI